MADLLKGKHVLVTGGASGIGRAIVEKFLEEGAKVFIFDREYPDTDVIARTTAYHLDVTNESEVENCMRQVFSHRLDILVSCAGIDQAYSWEKDDDDVWEHVLDVNLNGVMRVTAKVVQHMLEAGIHGSIIFITSVHTALAFPGGAAYDASKHGLVGLMRNIALELGPKGIRANAVAPGFIYPTGITGALSLEEVSTFASRIPSRRHGTPEDIANVVAFLASDQAAYVNGSELRVDGGLSIQNHLF